MFSINDFYTNVSSKTFLENDTQKVFDENLFIQRASFKNVTLLKDNSR